MSAAPPPAQPIRFRLTLLSVLLAIGLAAYGSGAVAPPVTEGLPPPLLPTATQLSPIPATPTPKATINPTANPVSLVATVWDRDPQVPVVLYHHFSPDNGVSDPTHIRLSEFRQELQAFYDSGYSLIPLARWLAGDLRMPAGRRPLILTIDDLFFADQVFLNPDGTISPNSGLGTVWQFAQEHPDFGFSVALFYNLGDKDYANLLLRGTFLKGAGWEDALTRTIIWSIEHDAIPYNHFYHHPYLDRLSPEKIIQEARDNDLKLRALLANAGRSDLEDRLGNVLALPYGHWPVSAAGKDAVTGYLSPSGLAVQGIMEVGATEGVWYLQAAYSPNLDINHIPRRVGGKLITTDLTA
ncbi:MAG: hypothetical protein PHQ40_18120, partial [Anaerolineaceae bacterium]|nr:hypothetical protein [Anaerolineaceae bacterium]